MTLGGKLLDKNSDLLRGLDIDIKKTNEVLYFTRLACLAEFPLNVVGDTAFKHFLTSGFLQRL